MSTLFQLYVTYQQVSVFDPNLAEPFNFWKDEHVAQGFSWRKQSVGFGTLDPDGTISIDVRSDTKPTLDEGVIRAIVVPFERPETGNVEIATITESHVLGVPAETTGILYQAGIAGDRSGYGITFLKGPTPPPQILVADSELSPPEEGRFLMDTVAG
jgi:hypothetical protein